MTSRDAENGSPASLTFWLLLLFPLFPLFPFVFPGVVFPFAAVDPFSLVLITFLVVAALPLEFTDFVLPAVVIVVLVDVVIAVIIVRHGRPHSGGDHDAGFSLEQGGAMVRPPARHIRMSFVFIAKGIVGPPGLRMWPFDHYRNWLSSSSMTLMASISKSGF